MAESRQQLYYGVFPERSFEEAKLKTFVNLICVGLLSLNMAICGGQQAIPKKSPPRATSTEALAKPTFWEPNTERFFTDSPLRMTFNLATSWIPGSDHKGMFRYKIIGNPVKPNLSESAKDPDLTSSKATEEFINRIIGCDVNVALYDTDGFVLRTILLDFKLGVDNEAHPVSLIANSSAQMGSSEYRMFVGDEEKSGQWAITWSCRGNP
jgi:hypothetical protein